MQSATYGVMEHACHLRRRSAAARLGRAAFLLCRTPKMKTAMAPTPVTGFSQLASDPAILGGALAVRGTRVPVRLIGAYVRAGRSEADVLGDFPFLSRDQVEEAVRYYRAYRAEIDCELDAEERWE